MSTTAYRSTYRIPGMDCPSEENLIRMRLADVPGCGHLEFDLDARTLAVWHQGESRPVTEALESLDLGAGLVSTEAAEWPAGDPGEGNQARLLRTVLIINAAFFAVEMIAGWLSGSMGLVADSLDMLADALVYGLSLMAVGAAVKRKKQVATLSGYFQLTLALGGLAEVLRRFFGVADAPDFATMMVVSALALTANVYCLYLLRRASSKEAHMQASLIFTSNDVIINAGVIVAGLLVFLLDSNLPDLAIGAAVFVLVVRGAVRILKLGR